MPKNAQHSALVRMIELMRLLPTKGAGITSRQLADALRDRGYDVTKRTVERDLQELSRHFPIECNSKSTPFGWRWMEGGGADLPGMSVEEAMSLRIAEGMLRLMLPAAMITSLEPRFRQAERKLDELAKRKPRVIWTDKVRQAPPALPLLPPKIAAGVLDKVQEALLDDLQLEIQYRRPGNEATGELRLHPLGLVQRGPVTYLVATAFDYADVRLYAVHRILAATKTGAPARRPQGFSLDDFIAGGALQFGKGKMIRLKAAISDDLTAILAETPLTEDQRLSRKGDGHILTASIADTPQLRWWILSWAGAIRVVAPAQLRRHVIQAHQEAIENHK